MADHGSQQTPGPAEGLEHTRSEAPPAEGLEHTQPEGPAEDPSDPLGKTEFAKYTAEQVRRARELLTRLYSTRRSHRLYPSTHPTVKESLKRLADVVRAYHAEKVDITLTFHEGEVYLGDQLLPAETRSFAQLIYDLEDIAVGTITIYQDATEEEIGSLLSVLASETEEVDAAGGSSAMLLALGVEGVRITTLIAAKRVSISDEESEAVAWESYSGALQLVREVNRLVRSGALAAAAGKVKKPVRSLVDNVLTNRAAMLRLTGLKDYDEYTFYHSANVAILSVALGSMITEDYRFLTSLGIGALLHDIGKLTVDFDILNKASTLSDEEWEIMQKHPQAGASMAVGMPGMDRTVIVAILEHHMRFDGQGYPTRTPFCKQNLASRIIAVADTFDAMTSKRSYSGERLQDQAVAELLKGCGSALDPVLVRLFIYTMGIYPPRSLVLLEDGRLAVVLEPGANPMRPKIRVIATPAGKLVNPIDIDLEEMTGIVVNRCVDPELVSVDIDDYLM
ncbi:MAG: HD domain-containing protein [Coriobacteriia bacterium]|nr:HD domain-containing protein [Coriobacteriia bacterium]